MGISECALLMDIRTNSIRRLYSHKSDVMAQAFHPEGGHIIYNGSRDGKIRVVDLRTNTLRSPHPTMKHLRGIISLAIPSNRPEMLVASSFDGQLSLWDTRMMKVVQNYQGHQNEAELLRVSIAEDQFVCAGGNDRKIRLWN